MISFSADKIELSAERSSYNMSMALRVNNGIIATTCRHYGDISPTILCALKSPTIHKFHDYTLVSGPIYDLKLYHTPDFFLDYEILDKTELAAIRSTIKKKRTTYVDSNVLRGRVELKIC